MATSEVAERWDYNVNVYYNPEKVGLKLMADIEFSDECYQYDKLIVLRDKATKKLYYATDAGCSCPTPFEDYRSLSDLYEFNYDEIKRVCQHNIDNNYGGATAEEIRSFLNKVRRYK